MEPFQPKQLLNTKSLPRVPVGPPRDLLIDTSAPTPLPPPSPATGLPSHLTFLSSSMVALSTRILQELESDLAKLMSLNRSRREAIILHLERLAGLAPGAATGADTGPADADVRLKRWIEGPRSPAQNSAFQAYFEEISFLVLGVAVLLKAWSDRGLRAWKESDLGRLNWALSTSLKPHLPLDREGWQITHPNPSGQPNLYSWYNPSPTIQRELWNAFQSWRVSDEGPQFLLSVLGPVRQTQPPALEQSGYDSRFYEAIWRSVGAIGFNPDADLGPMRKHKTVFSPTLRDGGWMRPAPTTLHWVGAESSAFNLMLAELAQIWWGPAAPPFWMIGNGLDTHARDQLTLALGSPKPTLATRIAEMEACDLGIVSEERVIRSNQRSPDAHKLREQLETLPYYKKLRAGATSLGTLQACVALSKLRPGGVLLWAREEPLGPLEGQEALRFLLDRARFVAEWDFSELEHELPVSRPLFPRYLYVFTKDSTLTTRLDNRPLKITLSGQVRSHVEMPLLFEDAFRAVRNSPHAPGPAPRGQWQVQLSQSPTAQRVWIDHWPERTSQATHKLLARLKARSVHLSSLTTIRATPDGDPEKGGAWSAPPAANARGLWLRVDWVDGARRLVAQPLPQAGQTATGSGFLILVPDEGWVAPLCHYLELPIVREWLDQAAERKGDRWVLTEQLVRYIPIPLSLVSTLQGPAELALPLPGDWEKLAADVAYHPKAVHDALRDLPRDEQGQVIRASLFVRAARALDYIRQGQHRLFSLVGPGGRVRWREFLFNVLPASECVAVTLHPRVRSTGKLPPHIPIDRIERVKAPMPGILLATQTGFSLHLGSESTLLLDMIWDQLEGTDSPTWNELVRCLRLPRRLELAEGNASELLRSHGEQSVRLQALNDLLAACTLF